MKQVILQRLVIAAVALLTVPTVSFAQSTGKEEKKEKEKEVKTIVITRADGKDDKMTIVVDGDKITVNGKDIKDMKDVNVNVHTVTGKNHVRIKTPGQNADAFSYNFNEDRLSLYSEDENRAMLGVNTDDHEKGALIESVTEGSAAAKSGLKKGDVITKVGDAKVACSDDLSKAVRKHKPGEKVAVSYLRDGKEQNVTAELGKWKGIQMSKMPKVDMVMDQLKDMDVQMPRSFAGQGNFYFSGRPKLGLSIQDTDDNKGVTVLEVEEESNAAKAGIKKDDIILSIDDKEVKGTEDVIKTVRENKDKYTFTFKVQRAGKVQNIEVKFPKKLKTTDL